VKSHFLLRLSKLPRLYPWLAFHHGYTATDAKMKVYNQLDRWSLRGADRIITVSVAYAGELESLGIAGTRISVVRNSIDAESFHDQAGKARELREQFGLKNQSKMILSVGRLSAEKGHIHLIHGFAKLLREFPGLNARLVIIGDGPERPLLTQTASSLGVAEQITFTGHINDPRPYYFAADAIALPSLCEGSPNVLLEAMTAGLPIVATRVGGVPEMIADGQTGLLVDPKDAGSLASALNQLISDQGLATTLAENAKAVAATCYAPAKRTRALAGIYWEVGRTRRRGLTTVMAAS